MARECESQSNHCQQSSASAMGLCKCPKKKFTNQFCFEHRVNVCERCMLDKHPKCIVQSYVVWLRDSDYKPICEICHKNLNVAECIRLYCFDVFHWNCFNELQRNIPSSKSTSSYTCPKCKMSIFPPENIVSPVASAMLQKLQTVNWARNVLNMPLLTENEQDIPLNQTEVNNSQAESYSHSDSVINIDDTYTLLQSNRKKTFKASDPFPIDITSKDNYDDKYHKKSTLKNWILLKVFRNIVNYTRHLPRVLKLLIVLLIAFLFVYLFFYNGIKNNNEIDIDLDELNF